MASNWWQSDAYERRKAAGEVVTPGLVDWGGLINAFNAPYDERVGRLPDGPKPPGDIKGDYRLYYNAGFAGPRSPMSNRDGSAPAATASAQELAWRPGPSAPWSSDPATMQALRANPQVESFRVGTGPEGNRLTPNAVGYTATGPTAPKFPFGYPPNAATAAIDKAAPRRSPYDPATPFPGSFADLQSAFGPLSPPVHQLNVDVADAEGQMYADSMGIPVRAKSGKVYSPKVPGSAVMPSGKVAPRYGGPKSAPAASGQRGGLFGGGGGLLGMLLGGGGGLFGGGNRAAATGVGLLPGVGAAQAASGPGPTYTTTPFQEDRFQTTTGAQMPSSMRGGTWDDGYR